MADSLPSWNTFALPIEPRFLLCSVVLDRRRSLAAGFRLAKPIAYDATAGSDLDAAGGAGQLGGEEDVTHSTGRAAG
jgi:hypothetical protein